MQSRTVGWKRLCSFVYCFFSLYIVRLQEQIPVLQRKCIGDASEAALLKYSEQQLGISSTTTMQYREAHKQLACIPFNSTNKYQVIFSR